MATYKVLAELSEVYEIEIEADSEEEALDKAYDTDRTDWTPFADHEFADDWFILPNSIEEIE
jgi:hypothetical protein